MMKIKGGRIMTRGTAYKSWEELPIILNATQVALVLGISRANSYQLFHSKGFPTIAIGKRILVSKEKLKQWVETQEQM